MHEYKQRRLLLDEQSLLEGLWERFSQAQREQVLTHYGRWIAAALNKERAAGPSRSCSSSNCSPGVADCGMNNLRSVLRGV